MDTNMQNLNTKETMVKGVIVLNVSEMPQENISVGKEQNYLLVGDNAIWLKKIPDNSIDSIVTDPPAGISFMGRGWDTDKGGRDHWIAWMQEVATECKRVLKPGGHAFVWAIPRTSHWTATAWENAGFEIRDVVAHIFGSGFPKSLNIGKAVDKLQGNEREVVGKIAQPGSTNNRIAMGNGWQEEPDLTKGTSEWEGWGTALKPAREDWLLMRKPIESKTVAENCLKWGTGGINIDESRVETTEELNYGTGKKSNVGFKTSPQNNDRPIYDGQGRFPANLIHDNSEEVRGCFPDAGKGNGKGAYNYAGREYDNKDTSMFNGDKPQAPSNFNDSGNASRFFKSIIYNAKASKSERNKGCEELEEKIQNNETTQSRTFNDRCLTCKKKFVGSDNTICHCPPELKITDKTIYTNKNNHPTVKPIALMEYLIKMVTPKGGVVLDPFAGSGSTLVAAKQNGFQYIGIEMTAEYIPIIEARLKGIKKDNTLF